MSQVKIYGPYPHRDAWRCYLKAAKGSRTWSQAGSTREDAVEFARADLAEFQAAADLTAGELAERYLAHMLAQGRKQQSADAVRSKLVLILGRSIDGPAALGEHAARELYADLVPRRAAATHRHALQVVRTCYGWGLDEGLVKVNPWLKVRKVGRARRGKPQLMLDEARSLLEYCLGRSEEDGALAVLLALLCGMRCSEIASRTVREVDDGGRVLRIIDSKTQAGVRPLELPDILRGPIASRCRGRDGDAPLLPQIAAVPRSARQWVRSEVQRYCAAAGVRVITAHALRGQFATIAYEAAALPHLVAAALGHESSKTTERHYVAPGVTDRTQQRAQLVALRGGKG